MELIQSLMLILEKPYAKKGYIDFKKSLELLGKTEEAQAIEYLINTKYANSSNPDQK